MSAPSPRYRSKISLLPRHAWKARDLLWRHRMSPWASAHAGLALRRAALRSATVLTPTDVARIDGAAMAHLGLHPETGAALGRLTRAARRVVDRDREFSSFPTSPHPPTPHPASPAPSLLAWACG